MISHNDNLKVFFRSGMVAEGIVESWSELGYSLRSENGDLLVIMDINEIIAVKIAKKLQAKTEEVTEEIEQEYSDEEPDLTGINDHEMRLQTLKELREEQARINRENIARKLNSFEVGNVSLDPKEKYGSPDPRKLRTQPSIVKYSTKKDQELPAGNYGRMQAVPGKGT